MLINSVWRIFTTKLSYEALHPPLRQTAVSCCPSVLVVCFSVIYCQFYLCVVLVALLQNLAHSVGLCSFANVPPNALDCTAVIWLAVPK